MRNHARNGAAVATTLQVAFVAAIATALAGCREPASDTATAEPAAERVPRTARELALASPGTSDDPVDGEIERLASRLRAQTDWVDGWILLGRAWIRKARRTPDPGFYLNAAAAADVALALSPGSGLALNLKGLVLLNDHRFAEARDTAKAVLAADPDDPMALGTLSDAELELGNFEAAALAATQMMERKPNLPSYSRLAWLAWLRGDVAGAKKAYADAFDAGRGQKDAEPAAWILVQAALVFWAEGDLDGASAGVDMALRQMADYPEALVLAAQITLARGRAAEAVSLAERAFARHKSARIAWVLGDARERAGDPAGAKLAFAEVERLGRLADPLVLADFFNVKRREPERALSLIEAERETRGGVLVDDLYAWALYRAGRFDEARRLSDAAMRLGTPDPRLRLHAGVIRARTGDEVGGRALVERALAMNPEFEPTECAEARAVGSSRVDLQACKLEYSIVSPK